MHAHACDADGLDIVGVARALLSRVSIKARRAECSAMESAWKHLHRQGDFIVARVLKGEKKKYVGCFSSMAVAKKALAKHLKVSVADLPRRRSCIKKKTVRAPAAKGVYLRKCGRYEARDPVTGEYLGRYASESHAKEVVKTTSKNNYSGTRARNKREKLCVVRDRFNELMPVFADACRPSPQLRLRVGDGGPGGVGGGRGRGGGHSVTDMSTCEQQGVGWNAGRIGCLATPCTASHSVRNTASSQTASARSTPSHCWEKSQHGERPCVRGGTGSLRLARL